MVIKRISFSTTMLLTASCSGNKDKLTENYPIYDENDLGINYSPEKTFFKIWSPMANEVKLNLYADATSENTEKTYRLNSGKNGTWEISLQGDFKGKFYTFRVKIKDKWLDETPGIWAKAAGVNGNRAAIIDLEETNPEGWKNDKKPKLKNFADIILYEVHVRDFSISPNSGMKNKGKFLAFTEKKTKSPEGESTGLSHLKELGVTHIHLLPVFDYASIDETKPDVPQYNWGYDPQNYNLPEGGYSTNPYNPSARIKEFKQLVKTLHDNGFRVVMDVVYNHTFFNEKSNLYLTAQEYFYRYNKDGTWSNASGCNNETASERPMMRKYIVESVKYWAKEYHIDGFRFDLMGVHDIETMNSVRKALDEIDPTIFIYGEGWTAGPSPLEEKLRAVKRNVKQMPRIAVFNDNIRDALKGKWNNPKVSGFISGIEGNEESIKFGIVGATSHLQINYGKVGDYEYPYAGEPVQVINYVSCHDDLCLVDKLKESAPANSTSQELVKYNKLAQTIILTSQGVPFIYAGEEIYRDKKGIHNTFKSPDEINQINWSNKSKYKDIFDYYKGLIKIRKKYSAFRMNTSAEVQRNLKFLKTDKNFIAYLIDGRANKNVEEDIIVALNGNRSQINFKLIEGKWKIICRDGKINMNGFETVEGNVQIQPSSASIFVRTIK